MTPMYHCGCHLYQFEVEETISEVKIGPNCTFTRDFAVLFQ